MWINADLGEGCPFDDELFKLIDWANIACGGHAGDADSIRRACDLALEQGVSVGAHPSYPDRAGFGRTRPALEQQQLLDELKRQMDLFENIAAKAGCVTQHFKPHGQLYNDAAFRRSEADLLIELARCYPHLKMLALAQSPQVEWSRNAGLQVVEEAFPDRAYLAGGALAPRKMEGAVLRDPAQVKRQALAILRGEALKGLDGSVHTVVAQTLCVHGDNPEALVNARAVWESVRLSA